MIDLAKLGVLICCAGSFPSNPCLASGRDDRLSGPRKSKRMTQLIAAVCDRGKTVVALSDRMVTTGDMTLGFESPNRKAEVITDRSAVLIAGSVHEPDLVRDARERAKGKDRVRDIAEVFVGLYQELRTKRIEDEILKARIGIKSFSEYHQKQQMLHESVILETNHLISEFDLGLDLILVGVDDRAHVSHIDNPGRWHSWDNLGYCTVGMGDRHAENVFAWYKHSSNVPVSEALYIAFEAKKKAEMAGGVGPTTDAIIVKDDGVHLVKDETLKVLQGIYDEREYGEERKTLGKKVTDLKLETTKLGPT